MTAEAEKSVKKGGKAAASKALIVLAARECFASKGFQETSIDDIQAKAKISRGSFYYHFKSKDEVIQQITRENLGRMITLIDTIIIEANQNPDLDFKRVFKNLLALVEQVTFGPGKAMSMHVWSLAMINEDVNVVMMDRFNEIHKLLVEELKVLQKLGFYGKKANIKKMASAFFSVLIPGFIVQRIFLGNNSLKPDDYIESLIALLNFQIK
jgi:AcrR family transcriptional regulator